MATDTSNTVVTGVETTGAIHLTSLLLPDSAQLQPQVHILTVAYHALIFGTTSRSAAAGPTKESEPQLFHNDVRDAPLPSSCQDEFALDASANAITEPSRGLQSRKRRCIWMAAVVVVAVTMASIAGLACWSSNCAATTAATTPEPSPSVVKPTTMEAQPSPDDSVDSTVTATPTAAPVNSASSEEQSIRARQIVDFINSITLSGRSIALHPLDTGTTDDDRIVVNHNTTTIEEAAVHWLIYNDALQLPAPPSNNATLQFYLQQRYALTTLLFSTVTALEMSELYHAHECEWMGVECQSVLIGDSSSNSDTGLTAVQAVTAIAWHSHHATSNGGDRSGGGDGGGRPIVPDVGLLSSHLIKVELSVNGFMSTGNVSLPLLPPEIGRWTNLEHFSLTVMPQDDGDKTEDTATATAQTPQQSASSSPLPETIGLWAYLTYFFLSSDRAVTGSLPTSIGQWVQLKYFNVSNNAGLTGSLPTSIGQWTNLEAFSIASNALTGSLPDSIENWTSLAHASIVDNDIVGAIPIGICNSATRNEAEIYVNCDQVDCPCGATVCKCGLPFGGQRV